MTRRRERSSEPNALARNLIPSRLSRALTKRCPRSESAVARALRVLGAIVEERDSSAAVAVVPAPSVVVETTSVVEVDDLEAEGATTPTDKAAATTSRSRMVVAIGQTTSPHQFRWTRPRRPRLKLERSDSEAALRKDQGLPAL